MQDNQPESGPRPNYRRQRIEELNQDRQRRDRLEALRVRREELLREARELEEEEAKIEEEAVGVLQPLQREGVQEIIDIADDYRMKIFLQRVGNRYASIDAEELNELIYFINSKLPPGENPVYQVRYYDILEFFAIINEGLELTGSVNDNNENSLLKISVKSWSQATSNYVKVRYGSVGGGQSALVTTLTSTPQQLLWRLTNPEINFIISYLVRLGPLNENQGRWKRRVEYYVGHAIFEPIDISLDNNPTPEAIELNSISLQDLKLIWDVCFRIILVMHRVLSNKLNLTDCVLSQNRYRSVSRYLDTSGEMGYENAIQAFPLLLCKPNVGGFDPESELVYTDMHQKFIYLHNKYPIEDRFDAENIWIKIKTKRTYNQAQADGTVIREERFHIFTFRPIKDYVEQNARRGQDGNISDEEFMDLAQDAGVLLTGLLGPFMDFIKGHLDQALRENYDKYHDFDLLDDGTDINLECLMIVYTQVSRKVSTQGEGVDFSTDPNAPNNVNFISERSSILRPAYCKTASNGLIRKTGYYTEATNIGICLYEAYWTYKNLDLITTKGQRNGVSFYSRQGRKYLIMKDLAEEAEDFKDIVILGDIDKFTKLCQEEGIQIFEWTKSSAEHLDSRFPTLLIFDKHCICAKTDAIKEEHKKRNIAKEKKEKQLYKFRPLPVPEELPKEINYYLDIETSLDPETKIFKPYLICVVGEEEDDTYKWWGEHCKDLFIQWLEEKIDPTYNTNVGHKANKPNVSIWTYNGMRFDLIFLVRSMIKLPHFDIKGSVDNIKALQVCNVVFRDLLKIIPIGSLRKQSEFWGTEHKKGQEDFDSITPEFISNVERADSGLIPNQEQAFYFINRREEITQYCLLDCIVLRECVEKYLQWVWENLKISPYVISAAGLALRYFQTHHHPAINKQDPKKPNMRKLMVGIDRELYDVLKQSYKGGIVMNTRQVNDVNVLNEDKHISDNKLNLFDINSSYPYAMTKAIPVELLKTITYPYGGQSITSEYLVIQDTTLYQVMGLEWDESTRIPTIPKRTQDGLNHTIKHDYIDYIWGCELRLAISTGKIKFGLITKKFEFRSERIFETYVDELYEKRRKRCKEVGDLVGDKLYKLLLNSLYGKFGQKLYPQKKIVDESGLLFYASYIISPPTYVGEDLWSITVDEYATDSDFKSDEDQISVVENSVSNIGFLIHIASYVAACGRTNLMKGVIEAGGYDNVYYMDTDSLIIKGELPADMVNPSVLGMWAKEYENIHTFIAPAKKMYYIEGFKPNGEKYFKCKSKGLSEGSLTKQDYVKLINDGAIANVNGGEKWTRKHGYVVKQDNIKNVKLGSHRRFYNNGMDSYPLYE